MNYWPEFLTIVVAHALAVASPGPDFALVLRQSLAHGRRTAVWSSIGIGCGICVHIVYCLLGLGYVLKNSPETLAVFKYLGAAYLAWVGVQALRAKARESDIEVGRGLSPTSAETVGPKARPTGPTNRAAWTTGFLVNVLNPKAALFFIALFPLAVDVHTPKLIQAGYGLWMTLATAAWFCFVSVVFTREEVRRRFLRHGHWIDRALGLVFLGFAASLAFATLG
ncbi:MAG: LysE family translocator [Lacunisphaera sp.]|nr:LysE family translocator [Lacunisphaera sp.]